jgi:hypothetical protein
MSIFFGIKFLFYTSQTFCSKKKKFTNLKIFSILEGIFLVLLFKEEYHILLTAIGHTTLVKIFDFSPSIARDFEKEIIAGEKLHSFRVGKFENYTRNEWRKKHPPLKLRSLIVQNSRVVLQRN